MAATFERPSRSLHVSVAVKSLRLGWPDGFRAAIAAVPNVSVSGLLLAACFEDWWPSRGQLPEVLALDELDEMCGIDTHHGARGLSEQYASIAPVVEKQLARDGSYRVAMGRRAREFGLGWLPPRAFAEWSIWWEADPPPAPRRELDPAPFTSIPVEMADMHTSEGRKSKTFITVLSGHPNGHRLLMRRVAAIGWSGVRAEVHG